MIKRNDRSDDEKNMVKKKMKVLIITTFYPPSKGGIQTYTYEITKNLQNMGNEVTIFAISSNGIKKIFSHPFLKVYKENKKTSLLCIFKIHDAVLATSWFPSGLLGVFLSHLYNVPLYISAHGNEVFYPEKSFILKKLMLFCFNKAKKIFAVSKYTKKLLISKGVSKNKIVVIPNGTDPERFHPDVDFSDILRKHGLQNKKIILSISRLVERKNFGAVIEIMPEILKEFSDAMYLIGGTGPMRKKWEELARKKGVKDKIMFLGYIPDEELPKYYAMCNVFVMPSIEMKNEGEVEGFGIAFLEANASGKPVIGGRSGGIENAIVDGVTGILVNPEKQEELRDAILKLLKEPSIAESMGKKGRERIEKELNWYRIVEKLMEEMISNEN